MTEQQIKDEVLRYINDSTYNYAILIDGEWGSGKTYYVTNMLSEEIEKQENEKEKPRMIKYVSLYGCKALNDVQENIAWSFAENAREKVIKTRGDEGTKKDTISSNILMSSKKIGNAILKKFLSETPLYEIATDWLNLGSYIFIIDDLERCDCSLNEVFGFLNDLVEHGNIKVIIVANEKEISGIAEPAYLELQYQLATDERIEWPAKEKSIYNMNQKKSNLISFDELERRRKLLFPQKDSNVEYKKIREKLIGVTLHYEPDISLIISKIITSSDCCDDIKDMLQKKVKTFSNIMDSYHHHNLRTFQFFMVKVKYLLTRLAEISLDYECRNKICDRIISETFSHAVKFKANYKPERENLLILKNEQDATSTLIKQYVESGDFLFDVFKHDVLEMQEQIKASVPMDDAYYLLYQQYYLHTQEWCEEQLHRLIGQLNANRYPTSFYGRIIIAVQRLLELGFDNSYMKQIKQGMIKNICTMDEVAILDEEIWMIDDKEFKGKVQSVIEEINDVITTHSAKARHVTVSKIIKEDDWIERLMCYTRPNQARFSRDVPVFSKAEVSQWVDKLHRASPEEINRFRQWLEHAYPQDQIKKSYAQDADAIKGIKEQLEKLEEKDLIKKASIGWLVYQLNQIIQCNNGPDWLDETNISNMRM